MQLITALFVTFAPVLAVCQQVPAGATSNGVWSISSPDGLFTSGANKKACPNTPVMPASFTAKRTFASLRNTIVFYNGQGEEFAVVENDLVDWSNPFGYPGASLYIKASPAPAHQEVWTLGQNADMTHEDLAKHEEEFFNDESGKKDRALSSEDDKADGKKGKASGEDKKDGKKDEASENHKDHGKKGEASENHKDHGKKEETSEDDQKEEAADQKHKSVWDKTEKNLWDSFVSAAKNFGKSFVSAFSNPSTNQHLQLSAVMTGDYAKQAGNPFNDEVIVSDCEGQTLAEAYEGQIVTQAGVEARYSAESRSTENSLTIYNLGQPSVELVKVEMKQPCSPFPPFCARMGVKNWFLHGNGFEGQIVEPDYHAAMGDSMMSIRWTDGSATDMRFLTLYSAYQFSNTRWSPLTSSVGYILLAVIFCSCIRYCCCRSSVSSKSIGDEETETLMKTVEAPVEKPEQRSFLACCSRRGGRTISLSN